jgi:class 3 adenylate cyclase
VPPPPDTADAPSQRVLATVLFTDIVGSTEQALALGDADWARLLTLHDAAVAAEIERCGGHLVKSLGDGVLAVFDGPSRAMACALGVREALAELGLEVRAGVHTGECELRACGEIGGVAVHIGARVAALARRGEVLASRTVRDLSIGSPFTLVDRGEQALQGLADPWRLFAVEVSAPGAV